MYYLRHAIYSVIDQNGVGIDGIDTGGNYCMKGDHWIFHPYCPAVEDQKS